MKNYKIIIQYDATRYAGWQKQGNSSNTIQYILEQTISQMLSEKVEIHGSGRTDAGVHARGQAGSFSTNSLMPPSQMLNYMRNHLPEDIGICSIIEVNKNFHSRYSAKAKTYEYYIAMGERASVFSRKYEHHISQELNIDKMRAAARYLIGQHDFKGFSSKSRIQSTTVRRIHEITIMTTGDHLVLRFRGNGFLYHMVRILVGTLLEVGQGIREPEDIKKILDSRNRSLAGVIAPAKGLFLMGVEYD